MPPDSPFLEAILEHPEDDAPRLIYADWLEERGQTERAEFIRSQIEREKLPAADPRWQQLRDRERAILAVHETAWRRELPTFPSVNWLRFWRGLVGGADVSHFPYLRKHGPAIFAAAPIQFLRLFGIGFHQCEALGDLRCLERVTHLTLMMKQTTEDAVLAVAFCAHLRNLKHLALVGDLYSGAFSRQIDRVNHTLSEAGAAALLSSLSSPYMQNLTELQVRFHFHAYSSVFRSRLVARFGENFSR